ncbi:hypothetical protein EIP91_001177 [Steccherinum ochraceum]|uniref:Uncharacterized protein n=1 Tax=Steccherinum ochraceum TaxID=92696 RepID=A0A4R0RXR0_9APHY|nr:hypothetical protein EIP91_001177 [Steccherinum ochraceum]
MNTLMNMFFFALITFTAFAAALPVYLRDVFVPPITSPDAGTIWVVGQTHNVTWDINGAPSQITNTNGTIVLVTNGRLDLENPLADNFSILDGFHPVTVPDVPDSADYALVLFGDSGNISPNFTIIHTAPSL